jgi:hypothetical protein
VIVTDSQTAEAVAVGVRPRHADLARQHGVRVEVHVVHIARDQQALPPQTNSGNTNPQRSILLYQAGAIDQLRQDDRQKRPASAAPHDQQRRGQNPAASPSGPVMRRNAATIPSSTVWLMASLVSASPAQQQIHPQHAAGDSNQRPHEHSNAAWGR